MNSPTTAITRTRPTPRTASRRRSATPTMTAAFSVATGRHSPDSPERTRAEWQHDGRDGTRDSDGAPGLACGRPLRVRNWAERAAGGAAWTQGDVLPARRHQRVSFGAG